MFKEDGYVMVLYGCLEVDDEVFELGGYIFMEKGDIIDVFYEVMVWVVY